MLSTLTSASIRTSITNATCHDVTHDTDRLCLVWCFLCRLRRTPQVANWQRKWASWVVLLTSWTT